LLVSVGLLWRVARNLTENVTSKNVVLNLSETTAVPGQEDGEDFP